MESNKWQLHRAGILNYWYYDEAEFLFAGGRLLLRGSNGAGKSVTMQSLITLLLDGVKSAERLDSFGSRSRRIEDYLLGEKEISNYDERTGYLFLEYKRQKSEQYITTGIGLHARRNAGKVDFWGFIVTDNRRINKDFYLYKMEKNPQTGEKQRIPLSRRELENRLGTGGRLTLSQKEYMQLVNRYIFGFKDIDKYRELMRLLIQLRSPKLSRDFKPSVIYEILNESLPALSEEQLQPLSETIESMEKTKLAIEQLQREEKSFNGICREYDAYNRGVLVQQILADRTYKQRYESAKKKYAACLQEQETAQQCCQLAQEQQQKLIIEQDELSNENEELKNNKIYRAASDKRDKEELLQKKQNDYERLAETLSEKKRREFELTDVVHTYEEKIVQLETTVADILDELTDIAKTAQFVFAEVMQAGYAVNNNDNAVHFSAWQQEIDNYSSHLQCLRRAAQAYQKLTDNYSRIEKELGQENKLLDEYQRQYEKITAQLEEQRDKLVKAYYEWKNKYKNILPIDIEAETRIITVLQELYDGQQWEDAVIVLENQCIDIMQHNNAILGEFFAKQKILDNEIEQLEQQLKVLRETKEAVPMLSEEMQQARKYLTENKIKWTGFYESVEFRETVTAQQQCAIEAALTGSGVLNALILESDAVNERLPQQMRGNIVGSAMVPVLAKTLFDYLQPGEKTVVGKERIASILSSIVVDEAFYAYSADAYISINVQNGAYHYGNISGCEILSAEAMYLGSQARKLYRQKQIIEKQQILQERQAENIEIKNAVEKIKNKITQIVMAKKDFPTEKEIKLVYNSQQQYQSELERQSKKVADKERAKGKLAEEMRQQQQEINKLRGNNTLPFTSEAYENAQDEMQRYNSYFAKLQIEQKDYDNVQRNRQRICADIDYVQTEIDEFIGQRLECELEVNKLKKRLDTINSYLQETDIDKLDKRIAVVMQRLSLLPKAINEQVAINAKNQGVIEQTTVQLEQLQLECNFYKKITEAAQKLLNDEIARGLIIPAITDESELANIVKKWEKSGRKTLTQLMSKLNEKFSYEQMHLQEYRLQIRQLDEQIMTISNLDGADRKSEWENEWNNLAEKAKRQIIVIETAGNLLNPYQQADIIKKHLIEQENLLSEQDKRLYEEIIMNDIGRAISQKIYAAEYWVKQMNSLMQKSDTSSGIKFRLEWKPLRGQDDAELDTGELVDLLHMDPALLKDEDMKKIVEHFSARIKQAKEEAELQQKDLEFFQQAVRDLLDYRQWFNFKLFYDQGQQIKKRELTDKIFFRFSGGEKAMAMYIPLFSAAYSRYLEAGKDAPFIITLDEAFAGVDEKNIRDMFNLVEKLGFNYIMNSQAIWGDYDVVPQLNMYELLRPANAPYVQLFGCHWDGHVRKMLLTDEDIQADEK